MDRAAVDWSRYVEMASPSSAASVMTSPLRSSERPPHILVVDDDREIGRLLGDSLGKHGYRVSIASDAREMDRLLLAETPDLILLDIMMPGETGLDACRRIRREGGPPIIFLSALGEETDRIIGLELGASHYLPKPCSAREVLATVRAALRMQTIGGTADDCALRFAGWTMNVATREVVDAEGVLIGLTDGEFALLRFFAERPRRILSRDQLIEGVRGPTSEAFDRAIDVQISRLRRKLGAPGDELIRTVRNEGYMFTQTVTRR